MRSHPFTHKLAFFLPGLTLIALVFAGHALMPDRLIHVAPPLFLIALYFWTIFTPTLLPLPLLFITGLFADIALGFPLGVMALLAMFMSWQTRNHQRFLCKQSFTAIWWQFCTQLGMLFILLYLGMSLYMQALFAWQPLAIQYSATIVLYPVLHWCFYALFAMIPNDTH